MCGVQEIAEIKVESGVYSAPRIQGLLREFSRRQVGQYKSTNSDAAAGTKAQVLKQPALQAAIEREESSNGCRRSRRKECE